MFLFDYPNGVKATAARSRFVTPSYVGPLTAQGPGRLKQALGDHFQGAEPAPADGFDAELRIDLGRSGTRLAFTGRRRWVTQVYASMKAGQAIQAESTIEPLFLHEMEVDTGISDYRTQAACFKVQAGGRWRTYFADVLRLLADGSIEVAEVKADPSALKDDEYKLKLDAVSSLCASLGWRFHMVYGCDLRAKTAFNFNVGRIQLYRFASVPALIEERIRGHLLDAGPARLGEILEIAGGGPLAKARVCAMHCRRVISLELAGLLNGDTEVRLVEEAALCK